MKNIDENRRHARQAVTLGLRDVILERRDAVRVKTSLVEDSLASLREVETPVEPARGLAVARAAMLGRPARTHADFARLERIAEAILGVLGQDGRLPQIAGAAFIALAEACDVRSQLSGLAERYEAMTAEINVSDSGIRS